MSKRSVVLTFLLAALQPALADAACNVIPQSGFGFRGVRGHVDQPFFVDGDQGAKLTLRAACGSPALPDATAITIGFFPRGPASAGPVVIPGDSNCPAARQRYGSAIKCVRPNQVDLATPIYGGEHVVTLKIPKADFAGPVSLVVIALNGDFPADLAAGGCAGATLGAANICIDDLFRSDVCGTTPNDADPNFAAVTLLSKWNQYHEVCTDDFDVSPKCKGTAKAVVATLDGRGDVYVPMYWDKILRLKKDDPDFDRRLVRGSTAIEAFNHGNLPIAIPGSEFLESLSAAGLLFDRKPLFVAVDLIDRGNELTLFGNADKTRSVLRISRRKLWAHACDGGANAGQACNPEPQDHEYDVDCPGATCALALPPRYFFCDKGDRPGRPCVRPFQCPGGKCVAGSVCQSGPNTGKACENDVTCVSGECGPGIFDVSDRAVEHVLELKRTPGEIFDDGVCDGGDDDGDRCSATCYNFPFSFNSCVTYRGEAVIYAP